jgi:hypothetical protein
VTRRDFLLDSGAISALAEDRQLLDGYSLLLERKFDGRILVPNVVMGETRTGDPRRDVRLNLLIKHITTVTAPYITLTDDAANRAGVLRHLALKSLGENRDRTRDSELTIDAFVVAIAEELSRTRAVTILTGDLEDIALLVKLTGRTNIDVVRPR